MAGNTMETNCYLQTKLSRMENALKASNQVAARDANADVASDGLDLVRKIASTNERLLADEQAQAILKAMGWVRPVRCRECVFATPSWRDGEVKCGNTNLTCGDLTMCPDDYCSYGERKE